MTIHTIEYRGYVLRAYSQQVFPPLGDPFAKGPKRFAAIVQIDAIEADADSVTAKRYSPVIKGEDPANAEAAASIAIQYGKDIVDGKVQAGTLYNTRGARGSRPVRPFQPRPAGGMADEQRRTIVKGGA